jgi:hypothetical protein
MLLSIFNYVHVLGIKDAHASRNSLVVTYFVLYSTILLKFATVTS